MSDEDQVVGYCKPPKSGQFKKGKSGNPKGRPKGTRNLATDLSDELNAKIAIKEGEKIERISKQRAMLKQLFAKALRGDIRAISTITKLIESSGLSAAEGTTSNSVSASDAALMQEFLNKHNKQGES